MWVAKNCLTNAILSSEFECIYDCQNFIYAKCSVLNYLGCQIFSQEDHITDKYRFNLGNIVRCWNIEQNRWCSGFDF